MARGFQFRRTQYRSRLILTFLVLLVFALIYGAASLLQIILPQSEENQVVDVVDQFYQLEQSGDFGSSWELFHSAMKARFEKQTYILKKTTVFLEDFGVNTFQYTIGEPEFLSTWQMVQNTPEFDNVYKVPVTQTYQSLFGIFSIQQDIYLVEENDVWRILWPYTDQEIGL